MSVTRNVRIVRYEFCTKPTICAECFTYAFRLLPAVSTLFPSYETDGSLNRLGWEVSVLAPSWVWHVLLMVSDGFI